MEDCYYEKFRFSEAFGGGAEPRVATTLAEVFSPHPNKKCSFGFTLIEVFHSSEQSRKIAFTLAEVLITLGIIGVVAALTMPALVANINDKALEAQNKKAQNVLANAFKKLMVKDDVTRLEDTKFSSCGDDKDCIAEQFKQVLKIVDEDNSSISDIEYEFESAPKKFWDNNSNILYNFITSDGMIFALTKSEDDRLINVIGDINGLKRPNKGGKDLCKYSISNVGTLSENCEAMKDYRVSTCSEDNLDACNEAECNALNYSKPYPDQWIYEWNGNECYRWHSDDRPRDPEPLW